MLINRYRKQPGETRRYPVDYSRFVVPGELLSSITTAVSIVDGKVDPQVTPLTVVSAVIDPTTHLLVSVYVQGGHDGELGQITLTVATTDSQVHEGELEVDVVED